MKLADCRKEIDAIDIKIVKLINRRAQAVRAAGILKAKANLPIVDLGREREILRNVCQASSGDLDDDSLIGIYQKIIHQSRELQFQTKTVYAKQGIY